jgi:cell division protein FtsW (lipid II flippase)
MWAGWAVDELLVVAVPAVPADVDQEAPVARAGLRESIGTRVDAVSTLPPDAIASGAALRLDRFRADAQAHPLCTEWTCRTNAGATAVSAEQAGWARDRILRPARQHMLREDADMPARLERSAARAAAAPETLLRSLHLILGLTLAGVCLSWWRGAAAWPNLVAAVTTTAAALAHQAVALTSFDLRHVQLNHLLVGAWALPAGLIGGVLMGGLVSRSAWVERLSAAWLSIGPGSAAWVRGGFLLVVTVAWTWGPGLFGWHLLPAQQMEGLLAIAAFALATFVIRNLAWTEATGHSTAFGWPLVVVGVLAGSIAALARGDGGALALTLGLALAWLYLSGPRVVLLPVAIVTGVIWSGWLWSLPALQDTSAPMPELLEMVVANLPNRIGERVAVAWTPFGAGPSDVARVIGLVDLAGGQGFGFAPPLEGLAAGREADRRLLQLTADYMPAVLVGVYGAPVAGLLLGLHAGLLLVLAVVAVRRCVSPGVSSTLRLLSLWGVFGLFGAVLRIVLSAGGTLGVLPLTGVPAPGLSVGTSAALATGVMAGLAWSPAFWDSKEHER